MPRVVDRDQRRREIAAALWRVAYRDGWSAVSLRGVAAEAGLSLGSVQHFFAGIDDLLHFAVSWVRDVLDDRLPGQLDNLRGGGDPRTSLSELLSRMIPGHGSATDDQWRVHVLAWLALVQRAVQNPDLGADLVRGSTQLSQAIAVAIRTEVPDRGQAESMRDARGLLAVVEGLIVQLGYGLLDPHSAVQILEQHVARVLTTP